MSTPRWFTGPHAPTLGAALLLLTSCSRSPTPTPEPSVSSASASASVALAAANHPPSIGDPARGRALVEAMECSRCHDGMATANSTFEKQCFHCHQRILDGTFKAPRGLEKRWHDGVMGLRDAPTLTASNQRFKRSFIASFLLSPNDLRPRLAPTMPRLPLGPEQANDIAAFLGAPEDATPIPGLDKADPVRGRALLEAKGCPSCHVFSGVPPLAGAAAIKPGDKTVTTALALAPDLRHARDRLFPSAILAWIQNPRSIKSDTAMPDFKLLREEALDITAYVLTASLEPIALTAPPARLPRLTRKVGFDEVSAKVFRRTCWHCHGEPDYAVGDGGPGNTGGFGFKPRGLSFVDYGSVAAGFADDEGNRHSVFEAMADGTPRIVAALIARQEEEAGKPRSDLRGMPLGYPALSPQEVQIVESWVAQGRPP